MVFNSMLWSQCPRHVRWLTLLNNPWRCSLVMGLKMCACTAWVDKVKVLDCLHLSVLYDVYPKLLDIERDGRDLGMSDPNDVGIIECVELTWFSGQNIKF